MFVANGASCDAMKDRFGGMWSLGNGPSFAKVVRLSAVITRDRRPALANVYIPL